MKQIIKQFFKFIGISGLGWLLDFFVFTWLNHWFHFLFLANMISASIAVTLVFYFSVKKTFCVKENGMSLKKKYIVYLCCQGVFIFVSSFFIKKITTQLYMSTSTELIKNISSLLAKIIMTPFTMTLNFFVMKGLTEKL